MNVDKPSSNHDSAIRGQRVLLTFGGGVARPGLNEADSACKQVKQHYERLISI